MSHKTLHNQSNWYSFVKYQNKCNLDGSLRVHTENISRGIPGDNRLNFWNGSDIGVT